MQLTPIQIPVDSRTKQLMAVVQTLYSAPTKKNGKKRSGPARLLCVADRAHQPKHFVFPRRSLGTKGRKRAFNPAWLDKWSWLDYNEANDHVV